MESHSFTTVGAEAKNFFPYTGVAIFAFVDAALLKPLRYLNPSCPVALFESTPLGLRFHLSYLDYLDWRRLLS